MPLKTPEPPAVDLHVCAQPDALAWVRFPKPAAARGKGLHRRLVHTVLLRVPPDGSIWLLRATGMPWSEAHLHAAAAVLGQAGSRRWSLPVLENQLAEAVCGPPVTIALPRLDGIDASQWDTRNAAVAHVVDAQAARAGDHNAHDLALALDALHRSITSDLETAHRTFFDALDGEALEITRQQGADALTYNFLVSPAHRRNRVQFAKCFPILLPSVACGDPCGDVAQLRNAVDTALPFVNTVARAWAVSPGAVRCLLNRPVDLIGRQWAARPRFLLAVLDALRPEDRPTDEAETWVRLNRLVGDAATVFGRHPWTSPLALSWLRELAAQARRGAAVHGELASVGDGFASLVEELRQALIRTLVGQDLRSTLCKDPEREWRARRVVDRFLARMTPARLAQMGGRYRRELHDARAGALAGGRAAVSQEFWPLLPEAYVSLDGTRRVEPLVTTRALEMHGLALLNCLRDSHLASYAEDCRRGKTFILGVFATSGGMPLSTAEMEARWSDPALSHSLRVVQHSGRGNGRPSPECRYAIAEVLDLFHADPHRASLHTHLRRVRLGLNTGSDAELVVEEQVLRQVIGDGKYMPMAEKVANGEATLL